MIIIALGLIFLPMINTNVTCSEWQSYFNSVCEDFTELKRIYPFSYFSIVPSNLPERLSIIVVAADIKLIHCVNATEEDFLGDYSKKIFVEVPYDYKINGCKIFGAKWIDPKMIPDQQMHIYIDKPKEPFGYEFCVGTPESFEYMSNVILENVKTAERMLIAYENFMTGNSDTINLLAYSHGNKGRLEFYNNKSKYISKGAKYGK